jgi:hypothetical protein
MTAQPLAYGVASKAAEAAYRVQHAEPHVLDFRCPRCKAEPGQLCPGRPRGHAPRQDRMIYARLMWNLDATNSGSNAENELNGVRHRFKTTHLEQYLRRNKARARKHGEPASTVTFGAWLLAHTPRAMPLAYLGLRDQIHPEMDGPAVLDLLGDVGDDGASDRVLENAIDQWRHQTGQEPAS